MKGKKELLILAGVVVLSLVYMLLHHENQYNLDIPEVADLNAGDIDKVMITGPKGALEVRKDADHWIVSGPGYRADEQKVKDLLEAVAGLTLRDLASEAKSYHRFGLDKEERIEVKAYSKEKLVRQFNMGKSASTYQHTYVQLPEDSRVFLAKDDFRRHLDQSAQDIRDHVVLKLEAAVLERMERQHQGKTDLNLFSKASDPKPAPAPEGEKQAGDAAQALAASSGVEWFLAEGRKADSGAVDTLMRQIKDLRCESFLEGKTAADFPAAEYAWTFVRKDGTSTHLTVHSRQDEKTEQYVVSLDGMPEPFLVSSWSLGNLVKGSETFVPKADEPAPPAAMPPTVQGPVAKP